MRLLAAAEGESDEVFIGGLMQTLWPMHEVEWKRFAARGYSVVRRELPVLVRAAHYGSFDALVVHVDLDDTLPRSWSSIQQSPRWVEIQRDIGEARGRLRRMSRRELQVAIVAPVQSTESWLAWARENVDGRAWESRHRHELKRLLFGPAGRGQREAVKDAVPLLVNQMKSGSAWPLSLREVVDSLGVILGQAETPRGGRP